MLLGASKILQSGAPRPRRSTGSKSRLSGAKMAGLASKRDSDCILGGSYLPLKK